MWKKFWNSAAGRYSLGVLISIDQLIQVVTSPIMSGRVGNPDLTISDRIGRKKEAYEGTIPWYRPLTKTIDWGLDKLDPGHSIDAIERDEEL